MRKDLKAAKLPIVVGVMGVGGKNADANVRKFKAAQIAGVESPEFKGNVALVHTDEHWDTKAEAVFKKGWRENKAEWDKLGSDYPYHYLGSARTMIGIGREFGEAMLSLRKNQRLRRFRPSNATDEAHVTSKPNAALMTTIVQEGGSARPRRQDTRFPSVALPDMPS